ncbi:MAG TPA: DNA glycosylase [Sphaerochaeta sp.]|nr:DNA glycosylase [Sphaerochaeta sp.]
MDYPIHLQATLFCGQCFGWHEDNGVFQSVVHGKHVQFTEETFLSTLANNAELSHYFDMDGVYEEANEHLSLLDSNLNSAVRMFGGLHILNQDPFEVLICFILSQNNNISRIRQMYARLANTYGSAVNDTWHAFPLACEMQEATEGDLRKLGMGFRAPYLVDAIQKHALLQQVSSLDFDKALALLMTIRGVGPKVGECILLYGFHRMEAFPMDTWMQKVMTHWYPGKDSSYFAPYAGIAQQYLFHYARTEGFL